MKSNKRKSKSSVWLKVVFLFVVFMFGMLIGSFAGEMIGEYKAFEKMGMVFNGANINVEVNMNTTELKEKFVEGFRDELIRLDIKRLPSNFTKGCINVSIDNKIKEVCPT